MEMEEEGGLYRTATIQIDHKEILQKLPKLKSHGPVVQDKATPATWSASGQDKHGPAHHDKGHPSRTTMLKKTAVAAAPLLTHLCNMLIIHGTVPEY